MPLTVGSMFTGCGGLDLGVAEALGGARLAWCADPDPHVGLVLAARLPGVPNLGDVGDVDWRQVPPVDVVTAGWPCQDISAAGRRAGLEHGARSGQWRHVPPAVAALRPAMVVLENVAALRWRGGGLRRVLADLASIGYDSLWTTLRASDTGAAHRRERVFLLAVPAARQPRAVGTVRLYPPVSGHAQGCWPRTGIARHGSVRALALPAPQAASRVSPPLVPTPQARDHHGAQLPEQRRAAGHQVNLNDVARGLAETWQRDGWGAYEPAIRRWESVAGRPAPPPAAPGPGGRMRMTAALPEFLLGFPDGWVTAVAGLPHAAQIQILGNAVAPRQAAAAVGQLALVALIMSAPAQGGPDRREAGRAA